MRSRCSAASASQSGVIAYRPSAESPGRELTWRDRQGRQTGEFDPITGLLGSFSISPDGRTIAITRSVGANGDIWLIETTRGALRRFTSDSVYESNPTWSPDSTRLAFHSGRRSGGLNDLYLKVVGETREELLLQTPENKNLWDWSRNGRYLLYTSQSSKTARHIWALPLDDRQKPFVVVQSRFEENAPQFSPDAGWIAYHSNESGRNEVYVQAFPGPGRSSQISINGGTFPQWSADGREIFYVSADNRLLAVPVAIDATRAVVEAATPAVLFPLPPASLYLATPDSRRFLINAPTGEASIAPITIVLNWKPPTR